MSVKFRRDDLLDLLWGDADDSWEIISDEISGTSRWAIERDLIFSVDGKTYITYYRVGATESQDEGPWEYDGDEIECYPVQAVEKTVTVWEHIR